MEISEIHQFKPGRLNLEYGQHRIDPSAVFNAVRFHVAAGGLRDAAAGGAHGRAEAGRCAQCLEQRHAGLPGTEIEPLFQGPLLAECRS